MKANLTIFALAMTAAFSSSTALGASRCGPVCDHWITADGQMLHSPPSSQRSPPCTLEQAKNFYYHDVSPAQTCYMGDLIHDGGFDAGLAEQQVRRRRLINSWTPDQTTLCKNIFSSDVNAMNYLATHYHGCDNTPEARAYATATVAKRAAEQRAAAAEDAKSKAERDRLEASRVAAYNAQMRKPDPKIGMTVQQMINDTKWGNMAVRVRKIETASGVTEEWNYGLGVHLLFVNGKLVTIQE